MASILLDKFRVVTGVTDAVLDRQRAIQAIVAGSALASSISGRDFGHAIEFIEQIPTTSHAAVVIHSHRLPAAGMVLLQGTGVAGLDGEKSYVVIDGDRIRINDISVPSRVVGKGIACQQRQKQFAVSEGIAVVHPGPISLVSEVRTRSVDGIVGGTPFDNTTILSSSAWYIDSDVESWNGEVEIYKNTTIYKRVNGRINPVRVKSRREALVTWYAGCKTGIPEDVVTAIASISKEIAADPSGQFKSENYDYYSYEKMDVATITKLPTTAVAVLLSYRKAR